MKPARSKAKAERTQACGHCALLNLDAMEQVITGQVVYMANGKRCIADAGWTKHKGAHIPPRALRETETDTAVALKNVQTIRSHAEKSNARIGMKMRVDESFHQQKNSTERDRRSKLKTDRDESMDTIMTVGEFFSLKTFYTDIDTP